ncbi:BBE domain-containing protein [Cellulosilyticum sp. I15G10I2]|uniref:BBE domain-containing protein n=1 Tax=Cellulosilyticum sp. I15G10I2 TaxID=1892843 RepID=UPI00085C4169|nr:BBE domain-containing protein [Cellulosilyticum sp. I15G10I2]
MKLVDMINGNGPIGSIMTALNVFGLGGKVSELCPSDTAFYYRDSHYILLVQSVFENNVYKAQNVRWVSKNYKLISSMTTGAYINFPFYPLEDCLYEYYGENASSLQCIKQHYDPLNIFHFQQSIK